MTEFTLSFRRLPMAEGWSINTFHQSHKSEMLVRLSHRDGRTAELILADAEVMDDVPRAQQRLLTWVSHVTGTMLESRPTRRITLDD